MRARGDGRVVVRAVRRPELGEEQAQVVRDLGDGGHGAGGAGARGALLEGDRGRQAADALDVGTRQGGEELARVGAERLGEAALRLGEDHVEGERGLARAARAGDDDELLQREAADDVLEVVLAGVLDVEGPGERRGPAAGARGLRRCLLVARGAPRRSGSAARASSSGVPSATLRPPSRPPPGPRSRSQSDGAEEVEVVVHHQDARSGVDQRVRAPRARAPRPPRAARRSARRGGRARPSGPHRARAPA